MGNAMTKQSALDIQEPIGFWSLDLRSSVVTLDEATSAYFQVDPVAAKAGVSRQEIWTHIHPDDLDGLRARVKDSVDNRGAFAHSYRIQTPSASVTYVRALGRCFANEAGEATHITGIILDVGSNSEPSPLVQVIELLIKASNISKTTGDPVLPRLIDAVLLEAGRNLAQNMGVD